MLRFHQPWLDEEVSVQGGARRARRLVMGVDLPSSGEVAIPVRRLRVLYALPQSLYDTATTNLVFEGHEFICPFARLTQFNAPVMQKFLKRMRPDNFRF